MSVLTIVLIKSVILNGLQTSLLYNFNRWQRHLTSLFSFQNRWKKVRLSLDLKSSITGFYFHNIAAFISASNVPKGHGLPWQIDYLESGFCWLKSQHIAFCQCKCCREILIVNCTRGGKREINRKLPLIPPIPPVLYVLSCGTSLFSCENWKGYVPLQHVWQYRYSELPLKIFVTQWEFLTSKTNSELQ